MISGDVPGIPNSGHVWNQVNIDGKWYNADLTWDAKTVRSKGEWKYFLLNDEEFYKDHRASYVDKTIIDYFDSGDIDYGGYYSLENDIKPFECLETYDRSKISEYFGHSETPQTSQEMIEDASNVPLTIEEVRKEASTIVDTQRAAVQIQNQEMGEVIDD